MTMENYDNDCIGNSFDVDLVVGWTDGALNIESAQLNEVHFLDAALNIESGQLKHTQSVQTLGATIQNYWGREQFILQEQVFNNFQIVTSISSFLSSFQMIFVNVFLCQTIGCSTECLLWIIERTLGQYHHDYRFQHDSIKCFTSRNSQVHYDVQEKGGCFN